MPPRATSSCFVWLVSILPLAVPDAERWLAGLSRTGWCTLPWLLYAGLPRAARPPSAGERRVASGSWAFIALALPPTALALRLDLAAGWDLGAVSVLALMSLLFTVLFWFGACGCAGDEAGARNYALTWTVLVPGVPFLCAALERGGAPAYGSVPGWLAFIARASPLGWIGHEMALIGPQASPSAASLGGAASAWAVTASALLPLCTCLVLFGLGRRAALHGARAETIP